MDDARRDEVGRPASFARPPTRTAEPPRLLFLGADDGGSAGREVNSPLLGAPVVSMTPEVINRESRRSGAGGLCAGLGAGGDDYRRRSSSGTKMWCRQAAENVTEKEVGYFFRRVPSPDTSNSKRKLWDVEGLFFCILSFCNCHDVCALLLVCKRFHELSTDDMVWKRILESMNLESLLGLPNAPTQNYYQYFVKEIITTRALHGRYTFEAVTDEDVYNALTSTSDGNDLRGQTEPYASRITDGSMFSVKTITLLFSSATLGQMNHAIGRVHLLIEYKDNVTELLQGAARFSWRRGCFVFCCGSSGCNQRGPVFTVAIRRVDRPWPNQSREHFEAHVGGLCFVMTPALVEGRDAGSRITETDIFSVSCLRASTRQVAQT